MSEITQDENCHLGIRETMIVDLTRHCEKNKKNALELFYCITTYIVKFQLA